MLWNYDRRVVAVLVFFILGTIGKLSLPPYLAMPRRDERGVPDDSWSPAAAGSDLGLSLHPLLSNPSDSSSQAGSSAILSGTRSLILVLPALATNFLSALLIGIQVWCVTPSYTQNGVAICYIQEKPKHADQLFERIRYGHQG